MFLELYQIVLPLFKKDIKDFFGKKYILFFRLKYLKVKKNILPDLAGFSVKCVKLEEKSYFRDEISRVLNTLNREKNPSFFSRYFRARSAKIFQYMCHFLNDFLRKRRAQRENFRTLHFALGTWRTCDTSGWRSPNRKTLHFAPVTRVFFFILDKMQI